MYRKASKTDRGIAKLVWMIRLMVSGWNAFVDWSKASTRSEYYTPRHSPSAIKRLKKSNGWKVWTTGDDTGSLNGSYSLTDIIMSGGALWHLNSLSTRAHA